MHCHDTLGFVLAHSDQEKAAEAMFCEEIAIEKGRRCAAARSACIRCTAWLFCWVNWGATKKPRSTAAKPLMLRARPPADHPTLLNIEAAYANTATLQQSAAAEPLFRQVIAARTGAGAGTQAHATTELALVTDLQDQHKDEEAAATGLPVARSLEALLGADNLYALGACNQYGTSACNSHQEQQGLATLRRVAAARQRIYPPGTWVIYSSQLGIGVCLFHLRQYAESESTLLAAVAGLEAARGAGFIRTQDGYRALSDLYSTMGKADDAAQWKAKLPH
jgi:hypothetical protein